MSVPQPLSKAIRAGLLQQFGVGAIVADPASGRVAKVKADGTLQLLPGARVFHGDALNAVTKEVQAHGTASQIAKAQHDRRASKPTAKSRVAPKREVDAGIKQFGHVGPTDEQIAKARANKRSRLA